jgi:4-hydroxybenzoate polyprenyltransferase
MLWTTGFNIIYSCQDHAFDRKENVHSASVEFGVRASLYITKALHTITVILLILCGISFPLGIIYYVGILIVTAFLGYENTIISSLLFQLLAVLKTIRVISLGQFTRTGGPTTPRPLFT